MTNQERLTALDRIERTRVSRVAKQNSPAAEELFNIAAGKRQFWTLPDWNKVLQELDACDLTVKQWRVAGLL
jgi:hypothetical protein